ncbi:hypothetical protein DJ030_06300 [bacterium endosymbiont of Escarpia laminata]|nr:MAG: hypothetical protein DJ030_06300 [bacterium endosymbiont of Escarpia laminata]
MLEKITTILEQFEAQGSFSTRKTTNAEDLNIEINSIGSLRFPLKPGVVKRMIKIAKPATFGWRDKTCLDSEVRNVWKIPKSRVKINKRRWNKTFNPTMDRLKTELGLSEQSSLRAELHEMLIYAPGQFFRPHQDSEKCDGMVATLVVVLPSPHRGGTLIIDHQGEKKRYQSSRAASDKLSFFAFYADCQHEVRPVTDGYRVVLIYNLILKEKADRITSPSATRTRQLLTEALGNYFAAPPKEDERRGGVNKLVYLLDYQYTPKGLSWKALKETDRLRASALSEAATILDLEIYLALADIQEIWDCEIDEPGWGYSSRRRHWEYYDDEELEDDSDDEADVELLELIDDSTIIKHWRDAAGKPAGLPEWSVYGREICWTTATDQFSPFESEYEGFMGNWGNTMERWYHRAAIILWRREDRCAALLEIAPETMIRELLQMAEKKKTLKQAQEITRHLLPDWSSSNHSRKMSSSFSPILRLALRLDEQYLARELIYPLSSAILSPKTVPAMVRLQKTYGSQWLIDVMQRWLKPPAYEKWGNPIDKLAQIIKRWVTHTPAIEDELTHWLMARQLGVLKQKHHDHAQSGSPVSRLNNASTRIAEITELVSAAILSSDDGVFHETIDHLISNEKDYLIFDLIEISRFIKQQSYEHEVTEAQSNRLLDFVRDKVTRALDSPPRKVGDWSITETVSCGCADCKVLTAFLQSSGEEHKVWPLAKGQRMHIHQVIDAMGVPVTHKTERRGSPHKLHLTKTKQLFLQDREHRDRLKEAKDDLAEGR